MNRESLQALSELLEFAYSDFSRKKHTTKHPQKTVISIGSEIKDYALDLDSSTTIYGYYLALSHDPCYVGHFINDRFKPKGACIGRKEYDLLSSSRANCVHEVSKFFVTVVITQPIVKDLELFVHYGFDFWMNKDKYASARSHCL